MRRARAGRPMRALALLAAVLLLPLPLVQAEHPCGSSTPEVDLAVPGGARLYVDVDDAERDLFVYREGNGAEGLQRADKNRDDTQGGACGAPDTFIALLRLP